MLDPVMIKLHLKPTLFQNVGQLFMYIGMLVCGGFIVLYTLKEIVKEIFEYVYTWISRRRTQ